MPDEIVCISVRKVTFIAVSVLLAVWIGVRGSMCPDSWTYYPLKKRCLKGITPFMGYDTAISRCKNEINNGELVRIEDEDDNGFLATMITLYQGYWIGLDDRETNGVWKDANCKEATWFNWDPMFGDPNGMGSEHCLATRIYVSSGKPVSRFRDQLCNASNYAICMVDLSDSTSSLFFKKNNTRSTKPAALTELVSIPQECAIYCSQLPNCSSYSLHQRVDGEFICELDDCRPSSAPAVGWVYFSKCK